MKNLILPAIAALLAFVPVAARAQTSGVISGHIYDQSGTPLRGVKVSASSETQLGGPRTATTDDEGHFRIVGLTPGRFTVTASAPKLKSHIQKNITVTGGRTVDLDVIMEVETAEEQIRIVEKAPTVNTTDTAVGDSFDADFLNELPLQTRDYQGVMALTPGVRDVSGGGNPSVRGGSYFNNSYQVDGFQTTDPVTHTFGQNFSFDAMQSVEVKTAAFGAENASTTGGVTNILTKSGSNKFELDTTAMYTDQNMSFFKEARDRGTKNRFAQASLNVGGPVVRDRIWYFFSAEGTANTFTLPRDPLFPDHPSLNLLALNAFGKINWQVTPRNKIELKLSYSPWVFENTLQSYLVEPEAEARQFQKTRFGGLSWRSALSDSLLLETRAGVQEIFLDIGPQSCEWDPANCGNIAGEQDLLTGVLRRNYVRQQKDARRTVELSGNLEWFKTTRSFGSHSVRLTARFLGLQNPSSTTVPGDVVLANVGTAPGLRVEYCSNDPKNNQGVCNHDWMYSNVGGREINLSLGDAWKPTRYLTISPSIGVQAARSENDTGSTITDIVTATPHISAVWDATHDGKTALRAGFNQYVDTGFLALARFTGRQHYSQTCNWDDDAQSYVRNCRSSGGESSRTVGLPCGPDGLNPDGTSCRQKLRAPRTWEYMLGGEREIFTGVSAFTTLLYRQYNHQWEDLETNAIWNEGGTDLQREGRWRTGRSEFVFDLETPDAARRRYRSVDVGLRKREGLFKVHGTYTWSKYEGTENTSYASLFLDNPGQNAYFYGPLPEDNRHAVQVNASYQVKSWLSFGVVFMYLSGGPYNRYLYDPVFGSYSRFGARRGNDSLGTVNPDDDEPLRLPDISSLDLQARANLRQLTGQNIDVFADLFNIMSLRTPQAVIEQDGPYFGRQIAPLPPTRLRVGLRYRY